MKTFKFAQFRKSRRKGVVIVTFAIGAFMLCGFAGLALDVAYLQMWKRKAQTAADAAAQAAAIELKRTQNTSSAHSAAFSDAAANGFVHNVDSTVTVENPPQSGAHAGDTKFAQVFVRRPMGTFFMRAFGRDAVSVGAVANSGLSQMDACIFVMEPSGNNAMQIAGSPEVQMSCGIQVNSTSNSALQVTGGAIINTLSYNVVGGTQISTSAVITPTPVTGMPSEDDPLAWRAQPSTGSSCDYNNFKVTSGGTNGNGGNGNNPIKMNPGVYCGGVDISSDRPVEMAAGLYIMAGGGFKISSQSSVTGTGVTIYNTETPHRNRGAISITGGVTVNLQAPRSGTYEAMLIWDDRKIFDNGPNHIEGTAASNIEGIIYMPNSILNFAGGSSTNAQYTGLVSRTLAVTGHSTLKANYAVLTNGAPLLRAVLVQ